MGDTNRALPLQRFGSARVCPSRSPATSSPSVELRSPSEFCRRRKVAPLSVLRSLFAVGSARTFARACSALRSSLPSPAARLATARQSSLGVPPSFEGTPRTSRRIASRLRPLSWGFRPFSARNFGSPPPPGLPHPVRSVFRVSHPPDGLLLPKPSGLFHPAGAPGVPALQGFFLPRRRIDSSSVPCPLGVFPVPIRLPWPDGDGRPRPAHLEFAAGPISPSGPRSPREPDTVGAALAAAEGRSPPGLLPP